MRCYEIRMYRASGKFSASCFAVCASDRHAMAAARALLTRDLPRAAIWEDNRPVGQVYRIAPEAPVAA